MGEIESANDARLLQSFERYINLSWDNINDFRVEMNMIEEEFQRDTLGMSEDEKLNHGLFHAFKKPFVYDQINVDSVHSCLNDDLAKRAFSLLKDSKWYGLMDTKKFEKNDYMAVFNFQEQLIDRILVLNSVNTKHEARLDFWRSTLLDDSSHKKLLPEICNQKFYFFNALGSDRSCEIYFSFLNPIEVHKHDHCYHSTEDIFLGERHLMTDDIGSWVTTCLGYWISDIFQKVLELYNEKQPKAKLGINGHRTPKQYYEKVENNCYSRECEDDPNTVLFPGELDQCVDSIRDGPHLMSNYYVQRDGRFEYQGIFSIEGKTDTNFKRISKAYFENLEDGSEVKFETTEEEDKSADNKMDSIEEDNESETYFSYGKYSPLERFKFYVREATMYARLEAYPFSILINKDDVFLFQARKFKELRTGSVKDAIKDGLFDEWDVSYTSLRNSQVPWVINLTSAFLDMYDHIKLGIKLEESVLRNYYLTIGASELKKGIDKLKYQIVRKAFLAIFDDNLGAENKKLLDMKKFEIPHDLIHLQDEIKTSLNLFVKKSRPIWKAGVTSKFLFKTKLSTSFKIKKFLSNERWHTDQAAVVIVAVSGLVTGVLKLYSPVRTTCSKKNSYGLKDDEWGTYPSFGRILKVMIQYFFINEVSAYKALSLTDYIPRLIDTGYVYMNEVGDAGNIDLYEDPFRIGDGKLENVKADCPFIFIEEIKSVPVSELTDEDRQKLREQAFNDLEDMHSKGIYHRDIDTRNLIIKKINGRTSNLKYRLIFLDFGISYKMILKEHATDSEQRLYDRNSKYFAETDKTDLTSALKKLFGDRKPKYLAETDKADSTTELKKLFEDST